jgi:phospholipid N-methyltransferase
MGIVDTALMLCKYVVSPRRTGSVCPSSRFLARKMVASIGRKPNECGTIVELGAGTGAITSELVKAGYASESKLYCIEFDSKLCSLLGQKFPTANILNGSAENIRELVGKDSSNITTIVSGLPLVSLPKECVDNIVKEVENTLQKGGRFIQFTYNLTRAPSSLGFVSMRHIETSFVVLNIPPARIDIFEKI